MNGATAMFALKSRIDGALHFARRVEGTKGRTVCVIWNEMARNMDLFTSEETAVIRRRYPTTEALCVGEIQQPERLKRYG